MSANNDLLIEINRKLDLFLPKEKKATGKTDEEIMDEYDRKLNRKYLRKNLTANTK